MNGALPVQAPDQNRHLNLIEEVLALGNRHPLFGLITAIALPILGILAILFLSATIGVIIPFFTTISILCAALLGVAGGAGAVYFGQILGRELPQLPAN